MKRSIFFWLAFVFALVIAIYLTTRLVMLTTGTRGITDIKTVSITTTNGKMDRAAIAAVIGIPGGTPTYMIRLDDVLARLMTVPDIETASVRRTANGNLKIRVNLRTVIAYWWDAEYFYPLATDGAIINRPTDERPANAVVFRGGLPADLMTVTDALKKAPKIMGDVNYVEWVAVRRWNLILNNGIVVMLPEKNIAAALKTLTKTEARTPLLNRDIAVLDLRDSERLFVKLN